MASFQRIEVESGSKIVMAGPTTSHLLVAAFDFGTTYSGYAFSFRDDPLKVQTNQSWTAGSEKLISLKTPTCVLLDPDRKFHSFGFQAENKYADLAENDKHSEWMFFRRFKMLLHKHENLSRDTKIEDINGKKIEAMKIFAMSIRYLKDHFLESLNKQKMGIEETDILYVLTVPAIWDDSAKQFMREAAVKAGIDNAHLKLALEPEAASLWCQVVTEEAKGALAGSNTKYMVVDLGGGTADITVHEKLADSTLRELHKASGGPWGGMYVDNNYLAWLEKLFGENAVDRFKKENMEDYFDLLREFETKKRSITTQSKDAITFRISATLREKAEETDGEFDLEEQLKRLRLTKYVSIKRDKMRVDPEIMRSWFEGPVNNVVSHVKKITDEPKMRGVNTILLVGGFGESQYVHDVFHNSFPHQNLIVPAEAGLVVLKGAVRFGHEPKLVSSRIMQYTYGIGTTGPFDESIHSVSDLIEVNGIKVIDNVFRSFVKAGENISTCHEIIEKGYTPLHLDKNPTIKVYCSTDSLPTSVLDPGCKKLGEFIVYVPEGNRVEDKTFDMIFVFGETELMVKARVQKTGREFYTTINCLK